MKCKNDFEVAMDDDFNTANAIAAIFELVEACKRLFSGEKHTIRRT